MSPCSFIRNFSAAKLFGNFVGKQIPASGEVCETVNRREIDEDVAVEVFENS